MRRTDLRQGVCVFARPRWSRPAPARGTTLIEMCVAMALLGLVAVLGLRLVFLTDRAMSRETAAAGKAGDALALAAQLRDDAQVATSLSVLSSAQLRLSMPGARAAEYRSSEEGTSRIQGASVRTFAGIQADFSGSTAKLLKVKITDAAGSELRVTIHRRNGDPGDRSPPVGH